MTPEEQAARMYPESETTYGYGAVREAYVYGHRARDAEVEGLRADRDAQGRFLSSMAAAARVTGCSHREAADALLALSDLRAERDALAGKIKQLTDREEIAS